MQEGRVMTGYGKRVILEFILKVLTKYGKSSSAAAETIGWMEMNNSRLGVLIPEEMEDIGRSRRGGARLTARSWTSLLKNIEARIKELNRFLPGLFERNLQEIGKFFRLNAKEVHFLELFCRIELEEANLDQFYRDLIGDAGCDPYDIMALYAETTPLNVLKMLDPEEKLFRSGLLSNQVGFEKKISVPSHLIKALLPPNRGLEDFKREVLGRPATAMLAWKDFEHVQSRDLLFNLLRGAVRSKAQGVNILLYGGSGTGKTEFCKTLAERLGMTLYSVGESDEEGNEPLRSERLAQLSLAQHLAGKRTLLLFDEMEDLQEGHNFFFSKKRKAGSKIFGNRLLENNRTPVLWTSNDIDSFDPALLRRMTAAVEFKRPPTRVRRTIWNKVLKENRVPVSAGDLDKLAKAYPVSPGVAANAAKVGRLTGGGLEHVRMSVEMMDKAMGGKGQQKMLTRPMFQLGLASTDNDLKSLSQDILGSGRMDFSLLLSGPPGSGKSLYARHLAEALGLEVLHKRASDLLSKWVGESEKEIAAAFEEATQERALLIFDEADSFLQDRRNASYSWEVTRVNEMLTWMESHPLPFVCTTNLVESLDQASMRRFTFKVKFDYLSAAQVPLAFTKFFNLSAPKGLSGLSRLTPADFAIVKKKAEIQGCLAEPKKLVAMLQAEERAKGEFNNAIGFGA
jgi:transitional endoplasmic reticulum ATPase